MKVKPGTRAVSSQLPQHVYMALYKLSADSKVPLGVLAGHIIADYLDIPLEDTSDGSDGIRTSSQRAIELAGRLSTRYRKGGGPRPPA